jgi:hypothetical protein
MLKPALHLVAAAAKRHQARVIDELHLGCLPAFEPAHLQVLIQRKYTLARCAL